MFCRHWRLLWGWLCRRTGCPGIRLWEGEGISIRWAEPTGRGRILPVAETEKKFVEYGDF